MFLLIKRHTELKFSTSSYIPISNQDHTNFIKQYMHKIKERHSIWNMDQSFIRLLGTLIVPRFVTLFVCFPSFKQSD